jgi:hypothetical protein
VASDIYFAGERVWVRVDEDPERVAQAFTSADGRPLRLSTEQGHGVVYINPASVAFWTASDPGQPEPQRESAQSTARREPVTDIWGQPLHRKRRR